MRTDRKTSAKKRTADFVLCASHVDVLPAIGKQLCEWRDYGKPFIVACLNVPMDAYLSCPFVIIIRQKRFCFRLA